MIRQPITQVKIDDSRTRTRVVIHSDPCTKGTQLSRFFQFELLGMLARDPTFGQCGSEDFQTLAMSHDGARWIVILEAIHET